MLLAVCALLSQVGTTQQFQPLLAALAAGMVIENLAVAQGDALNAAVQRGAPPVLVVFFVAVGASLRIDALAVIGIAALALSAARLGFIRVGLRAGVRLAGLPEPIGEYAWTGLVSQAGITLGFASVVARRSSRAGATRCSCCWSRSSPSTSWSARCCSAAGLRAGRRARCARRHARWSSSRTASRTCTTTTGAAASTVKPATGGVAVALDALMRERGGVWIAHGAGTADRSSSTLTTRCGCRPRARRTTCGGCGSRSRPSRPTTAGSPTKGCGRSATSSTCARSSAPRTGWRTRTSTRGSPRPSTRRSAPSDAPVFIQDYHLALVAPALRTLRPDTRTALFWHIPWPYPDRLRICPWRREILAGLLANDLLAFQLERDRRNFLMAAEDELEAEIEVEASRVRLGAHTTTVVSVPIGVDFDRIQAFAADPGARRGAAAPRGRCSICAPTSSGSASIGSTTPRAFPSGSTRSTR